MFVAAFAAGLLMQAAPQTPSQQPTAVDDVVVSARPLDQQIRTFLDDISLPERTLRVARFQRNVCVGAVNFRGELGQYVVDRVSEVGLDIGLEPGEPGCKPNILIIATHNGAELAQGMVKASPSAFNPGGTGMNRTRAALERFKTTDAGIRWWHVSVPMDNTTGGIAVRLPGEEAPQTTGMASRLRTEIRNDINRVIIIFDMGKLSGLNSLQVADYAAMVAYSQVDLDADFSGYDSILSLMTDREFAGLSDWDMAYLRALYSAELTQTSKSAQLGEIARLMEMRQIRPRAREQQAPKASNPL